MRPCPKCDYDLTGLPEEHVCPECGSAFDAHSTGIRLSARKNYRNARIMGVIWLLYFVVWGPGRPLKTPGWFLVVFTLIFVGMFLYQFRKMQTVADRMIFTREGVGLWSPTNTSPSIPWSVIKSASCSWVDGSLRIERMDNDEPITFSHRELGGVRIGKRCAAEINRLKDVYVEAITAHSQL